MVRPLEDLPLFGDGPDDRLERRAPVRITERSGIDLTNDLADAAPDRPEVFQAVFPEEPAVVGAVRVGLPVRDQGWEAFVHDSKVLCAWAALLLPSGVLANQPGDGLTAPFEVQFMQMTIDHHLAALRMTELAAGTDPNRDAAIQAQEGTAPTPGFAPVQAKATLDDLNSLARRNNRMQREQRRHSARPARRRRTGLTQASSGRPVSGERPQAPLIPQLAFSPLAWRDGNPMVIGGPVARD